MRDAAGRPDLVGYCASAVSTSVRTGLGWPSGATPPMACPVCARTNSGVARLSAPSPSSAATLAVSTRCAPEVSTSSGSPSASKISELAIWPTSTPSAAAAAAAVLAASGSMRTWLRAPAVARVGGVQGVLDRGHVGCMAPILSQAQPGGISGVSVRSGGAGGLGQRHARAGPARRRSAGPGPAARPATIQATALASTGSIMPMMPTLVGGRCRMRGRDQQVRQDRAADDQVDRQQPDRDAVAGAGRAPRTGSSTTAGRSFRPPADTPNAQQVSESGSRPARRARRARSRRPSRTAAPSPAATPTGSRPSRRPLCQTSATPASPARLSAEPDPQPGLDPLALAEAGPQRDEQRCGVLEQQRDARPAAG